MGEWIETTVDVLLAIMKLAGLLLSARGKRKRNKPLTQRDTKRSYRTQMILIDTINNRVYTLRIQGGKNLSATGGENVISEYLTEKELLEWLKVSRSSLVRWRKLGLPFVQFKKTIRYDRDKVQAWMNSKLIENEEPK